MKLIIDYDLIDKILDAKGKLQILRALKQSLIKSSCLFGIYTAMDLALYQQIDVALSKSSTSTCYVFLVFSATEVIKRSLLVNITKKKALEDLAELSSQLGDEHVSTSADLLLESVAYNTKYKICFNEKRFPYILQEKYIMIPTYDNGSIKETSILQEHELGSKEYVLSLGSPAKILKPAFAGI